MHVFSGAKRMYLTADGRSRSDRGHTRWFTTPEQDRNLVSIDTRDGFKTLFALLRSISSEKAVGLIEEICSIRDRFVKLEGAKALSHVDPYRAAAMLRDLALECSPQEASSLRSLATRLESTPLQIRDDPCPRSTLR